MTDEQAQVIIELLREIVKALPKQPTELPDAPWLSGVRGRRPIPRADSEQRFVEDRFQAPFRNDSTP